MTSTSTVGGAVWPDARRRAHRFGCCVLVLALTPFCAHAQMTIDGGNLYVGNENSYVEWEVPDIDGIDPVTLVEPLTLSGAVYVSKDAYNAPSRLTIRSTLTSAIGYVGYSPNGEGYAIVSGPDAIWTATDQFFVGHSGRGWLRAGRGATLNSVGAIIGATFYGPGVATVNGPDTSWTNIGAFGVGMEGSGKLYVADGAVVIATGPIFVGYGASIYSDRSALHVRRGGQLTTADAFLAAWSTRAHASVENAGSVWIINGGLTVGAEGIGLFRVTDGGMLVSGGASLGGDGDGFGRVTVTGAGSLWTDFGTIRVGTGGMGSLTVSDRGQVESIALQLGPDGTATLTTGGRIAAALLFDGGRLKLDGVVNEFGTLKVDADSVLEFAGSASSEVAFGVSSALVWSGVLTVNGYVAGLDSLRFGTAGHGLSAEQLARVYFADYDAYAQIDEDGYVTPAGM